VAHDDVRTVVEVDPAAALDEVVGAVTGLTRNQLPQAVLVGGYGGAWCSWDRLVGVSADENSVREEGLSLGAGVLIPVAADECGLSQASLIANYLAASSARQCGPCLFGLRSVADLLAEAAWLAGHPNRHPAHESEIHVVGELESKLADIEVDGLVLVENEDA